MWCCRKPSRLQHTLNNNYLQTTTKYLSLTNAAKKISSDLTFWQRNTDVTASTRTRVTVHHDPVQGRGMSEGKWGKGQGEIGVREGKEEGREGGEWEGKKKERGEAQEIVSIKCM